MDPSTDPVPDRTSDHYFSVEPGTTSHRTEFVIKGGTGDLVLQAESGVFSSHGLDKGTAVLLDHLERFGHPRLDPGSTICDLGCGSGPIALALASRHPDCQVIAIDVNQRARALCRENADRNHLDNITVVSPDDLDPGVMFDMIMSNPPIRIGKDALHRMLGQWLNRLKRGGQARLVVGKNLGADSLMIWLRKSGFDATKIASSKGFRIIEVTPRGQ